MELLRSKSLGSCPPLYRQANELERRRKGFEDCADFCTDAVYESQHGLFVKDGLGLLDLYLERKIALEVHVSFGCCHGRYHGHLGSGEYRPTFRKVVVVLRLARLRIKHLL